MTPSRGPMGFGWPPSWAAGSSGPGWPGRTLVVNPDGTTTAWNKDKTRVLHSHSPPARAG